MHSHEARPNRRADALLYLAAGAFGLFGLVELGIGIVAAGSKALMVDGLHNGLDSLVMAMLGVARSWSKRDEYSFRRCVGAAWSPTMANIIMMAMGLTSLVFVIPAFANPTVSHSGGAALLALLSFILNISLATPLHHRFFPEEEELDRHHHTGWWHLVLDALSAGLASLALAGIALGLPTWLDPAAALLGSIAIIGGNAWLLTRNFPAGLEHMPYNSHPH